MITHKPDSVEFIAPLTWCASGSIPEDHVVYQKTTKQKQLSVLHQKNTSTKKQVSVAVGRSQAAFNDDALASRCEGEESPILSLQNPFRKEKNRGFGL